jgi:hypothetical protein
VLYANTGDAEGWQGRAADQLARDAGQDCAQVVSHGS